MLGIVGDLAVESGTTSFSFSDTDAWNHGPGITKGMRGNEVFIESPGALFLGDSVSGPMVSIMASPAVPDTVLFPAHFHRSDSFRICLRGEIIMTPRHMAKGEFRLLEAGRSYSEGFGPSPEGIWTVLVMGDRRGLAAELAEPERPASTANSAGMVKRANQRQRFIPEIFESSSKGTPGVVSDLPLKGGRVDGTFNARSGWQHHGAVQVAASLLGDAACGPLVLLVRAAPDTPMLPECGFGTEIVRVVISGSIEEGDSIRTEGDVDVVEAGSHRPEARSGPEGADTLIVIVDRRHAVPSVHGSPGGSATWIWNIGGVVEHLGAALTRPDHSDRGWNGGNQECPPSKRQPEHLSGKETEHGH